MQGKDYTILLFKHMSWADAKVWDTVLGNNQAAGEKKIKELLYHLHLVQRAFFRIWKNEPANVPQESSFKNLYELANWGYEYHKRLSQFLTEIPSLDQDLIIEIPWTKRAEAFMGRKAEPVTLGETMLQAIMHSTYHRGQINIKLREIGGEPVPVDFIMWLYLGKPDAEWRADIQDMQVFSK
ncbi:MAG: DinB family protein [Methanococcaceae archaeon]